MLDWAVGKGLCLTNTCFQKKKSWLITFRLGETETVIDYILVGVERFNDRVMKVNIVIGDVVLEVDFCYCPQTGRSVNENEEFYKLMVKVVTSEVLVGGNFNGHVGSDMGGFREVHGGFGIGQINHGGIRLLDWAVGKGLRLMNTCFQKKKS